MNILRRLRFVVAGDSLETVKKNCGSEAWRVLADNGFVDRRSVSCVGFRRDIEANRLLVVLPKAFNSLAARERLSDPGYEREQVYRLIRVFRKIRRETSFSLDSATSNETTKTDSHPTDPVLDSFDAALRLRQDFRQNGVYLRKSPRLALNVPSLPLNWPKTLRRATTLLSGSEVFLNNTVHQTRKRDLSHPLSMLHTMCLKEIFALTGERSDLEGVEPFDSKTYRRLKNKPKEFLRSLKSSIFDERGRFLIGAITVFLGESSLGSTSRETREELLSYTKDFEDIWEQVLRDLMAPNLHKRTLPEGRWYTWPDASLGRGIQPEYDIRLASGASEVLVDAKDYRLLNGSKWLGSSGDHYKQVIYRQLIAEQKSSDVINILAFPSLGQGSLFAIRGCHHWDEIPGSRVFEVTVDYDLAIKRWLRETSLDIQKNLEDLLVQLREFSAKFGSPGE